MDCKGEAQLVLLACSQTPDGRQRWTLELLADQMVKLEYVEQIGTVNWQFRTADARIKLKRLYPVQPSDSSLPVSSLTKHGPSPILREE